MTAKVILDEQRMAVNSRSLTIGNQVQTGWIDMMRCAKVIQIGTTGNAIEPGPHHPILLLVLQPHPCRQLIEKNIDYQHPDHLNSVLHDGIMLTGFGNVTETEQWLGIETETETGGTATMKMADGGPGSPFRVITTVITALTTPQERNIAGRGMNIQYHVEMSQIEENT